MSDDLVYRLRKRAEIHRQIPDRKSVQEGQPDRIADLLEEAAEAFEAAKERGWVGLEEEEILKCFDSVSLGQVEGDCVIDKHVNIFNAIRAIEAKLKEKNT